MKKVKEAGVAGKFYPGDRTNLLMMISHFLSQVSREELTLPKAVVAPHAGYIYSGLVAAKAFQCLEKMPFVKNIILIGPSHYAQFPGLIYPDVDSFSTPFGEIAVNRVLLEKAKTLTQVSQNDEPFNVEHCLEVQLPFIQTLLPKAKIVPFLAGHAEPGIVGELLELLWGGEETFIVISSDLSHYHEYDTANALDADTTLAIEQLAFDKIGELSACGRIPIRGLLYVAKQHYMSVKTCMYLNSGDTSGDKSRVVGYGAYHFYELELI